MKKQIFHIFLTFLITVFFLISIVQATAIVDETFGTNGTLNINIGANQVLKDITVQADGKILIVGNLTGVNGDTDIFLARYNPDGSVDSSFGNNGIANIALTERDDFINDFELQSDGKIVAVGKQQVLADVGIYDFLAVRFNSDGSLDASFGENGVVTANHEQLDNFSKLTIQTDGKIVAVGGTYENFRQFSVIARINFNGSFDTDFRDGGLSILSLNRPGEIDVEEPFLDVEVLPNGEILTGGRISAPRPENYTAVGHYQWLFSSNAESVSRQTFWAYASHGYGFQPLFDAEVLPNGEIIKASGIGVYIDGQRFLQTASEIAVLPNGNIVTGGGIGGNLKMYSEQNLIGTAWNVPLGKLAVQLNNKILILGDNSITRVLYLTSQGTRLANFNLDDKTDFGVYRPSEKKTYIFQSDGNIVQRITNTEPTKFFPEYTSIVYNTVNINREVLINWEGGKAPNEQAFFNFERFSNDDFVRQEWGLNGDIPYGGDFDGNGKFDIGVFRPNDGIWYGYQGETIPWGTAGDKPVPADYDFDGITDYAIYRPSNGTWWIRKSSDASAFVVQFGIETDIPLTGDFDADGKADFTIYRPSEGNWYQLLSTEGFRVIKFGIETDIPAPGDYDGDGRHDIAVYRDGIWYLLQSTEGFKAIQFGTAEDIPISVRYDE